MDNNRDYRDDSEQNRESYDDNTGYYVADEEISDAPRDTRTRRDRNWGLYWVVGFLVAAVCVGVLIYIGWIDNNDHVDSRDSDNVLQSYVTTTPQPDAPGINDWDNPYHSGLRQIIVDHATGTNTAVLPE